MTRELRAGDVGKAVGGPMWDERELLPLLTVINGSLRGASFRLDQGTRVIGREAGVDVPLDDVKVSRRHATVTVGEGAVVLADAGSTNGTWLNEERVTEPRELRDGDRVRIGQVEMRFFDPASATTVPMPGRYTAVPASAALGSATAALAAPAAAGPGPAGPSRPGPVRLAPAGTAVGAAPLAAAARATGRMLWAMFGVLVVAGLAWAYVMLR